MERWFISLIEHNGSLYWITELGNHFMKMSLLNNKVEYLHPILDKPINDINVGSAVLCNWNDYLFYVVEKGKKILLYDLRSNRVKTIEIRCEDMRLNMYSFAAVINDKLIILPMCHSDIVQIDLRTQVCKRIHVLDITDDGFKQYYSKNVFLNENILEIFATQLNEKIKINLLNLSIVSREKITHKESKIINYIFYNDSIIFLDDFNQLYYYKDNSVRFLYKLSDIQDGYLSMCIMDDVLWILPFYDKKIFRLSLLDKDKKIAEELINIEYTAPKEMGKYVGVCKVNNTLYYAMHSGTDIVCIRDDKICVLEVEWPNIEADYKELKYQEKRIMVEKGNFLPRFLNCLCSD